MEEFIKLQLESLDKRLNELVVSDVKFISLISSGLLSLGGKRIRPTLCFLTAQMFGGVDKKIIDWAAAVELLHTATLLHDDMIDNADKRRGQKAAFRVYGNAVSVLSGDFLLSRLVKILASLPSYFTDLIADTAKTICEGEVLQFQMANLGDFSTEQYLKIIEGKTAILMQAAMQGTAVLCQAKQQDIEALANFGLHYGLAFQMQDDLLDLIADESVLGKPTGGDLHEGKATLPLIKIIERGGDSAEYIKTIIQRHGEQEGDLAETIKLAKELGTIEETQHEIEIQVDKALTFINYLPDNMAKQSLIDLAHKAISRNF